MRRVKLDAKTTSHTGLPLYPPCVICGKQLEPSCGQDFLDYDDPPSGATYWDTWGNYGSAIFDDPNPHKRQMLMVHICDECLTKAAKKDRVLLKSQERQGLRWEQWKPGP
jgi:hypothetical protein